MELPPRPTPAWNSALFDCGQKPEEPPQETTKARAEGFLIDVLVWGKGCQTMLNARGREAQNYGLMSEKVPAK